MWRHIYGTLAWYRTAVGGGVGVWTPLSPSQSLQDSIWNKPAWASCFLHSSSMSRSSQVGPPKSSWQQEPCGRRRLKCPLGWTYGSFPNAYISKPGPPLGHSDHLKTSEAITNNCSDPTSSTEQLNRFLTRFNDRSTPTNWTCPTLRWDCGDRPSVGRLHFYP